MNDDPQPERPDYHSIRVPAHRCCYHLALVEEEQEMKEWNDMNKAYVISLIVLLLGLPTILVATGNPIFLMPCLFWIPLFTLLLIEADDEDPDWARKKGKRDMRWSNYPIGYDSEERVYCPISCRCGDEDSGGLYDE